MASDWLDLLARWDVEPDTPSERALAAAVLLDPHRYTTCQRRAAGAVLGTDVRGIVTGALSTTACFFAADAADTLVRVAHEVAPRRAASPKPALPQSIRRR